MSECVIIDMTGMATWNEHHSGGLTIEAGSRPSVLQPNRRAAELEALRLAKAHPRGRFVVLEAVAVGMTYQVPTHVNLHGVPLQLGNAAKVVLIDGNHEMPF